MCGFIAGIFPKDTAPDDAAVSRALDAIAHRGPDGRGTLRIDLGNRVAILGHVRLAMVGSGDGRQPFSAPDAAAVVNGEFYGHREARARLERAGRRFATSSDSEVALHAFATRRSDAWLASLRGEWALAAIDPVAGTLTAACDPVGTRPLRHWTSRDGRSVCVASEAKALFALGVPREVDTGTLRFAAEFQYLPLGRTPFRDVGMLAPGHKLHWRPGVTQIRPWHDPFSVRPLEGDGFREFLDPASARLVDIALRTGTRPGRAEAVLSLLRDAVRVRLPERGSPAAHLSGGLDSAAVVALLTEALGPGVESFVAAFPWGSDEAGEAASTARHLGARLVPVTMTASDLTDAMDVAAFHAEAPAINAHAGAKVLLARAIRGAGHDCAFTGEGADEAFLGYEHLRADFPASVRPATVDVNPATLGVHRPEDGHPGPPEVRDALGFVPTFVRGKASAAGTLRGTLGPRLMAEAYDAGRIVGDLPDAWLRGTRGLGRVEVSRGLWSAYALSGYILRGLDDAPGMSCAVEGRLAFLDPAVRRFASMVPPLDHYGADGIEKGLLREALAGLLPPDVLARHKRPFMAPSLTATPEGAAWATERLLGGRLAASGLFDAAGMRALLASPDRPARESGVLTLASLSALLDAFDLS